MTLAGAIHRWAPSLDTASVGTTTLKDLIGTRDGTLTSMDAATDWVVDDGKYALDFDGSDDRVSGAFADPGMPFAVSLWAKSRSLTAVQSPFSIGLSTDSTPLYVTTFRGDIADDPVECQMRTTDGTFSSSRAEGYLDDTWHHIVAVFRSLSFRRVYIDGVGGTADTTVFGAMPSLDQFGIGCLSRNFPSSFFNGRIDDVTIFNREPSDEEITTLTNGGRGYVDIAGNAIAFRRRLLKMRSWR